MEDCKAILVEKVYRSRMELIEAKHLIGERICTDPNFKKIQGQKAQKSVIQKLALDLGISKQDAYYCVQFFEKYSDLSTLLEKSSEQKNLSWSKIVKNYLPASIEQKGHVCEHEDTYKIRICRDCGVKIHETK